MPNHDVEDKLAKLHKRAKEIGTDMEATEKEEMLKRIADLEKDREKFTKKRKSEFSDSSSVENVSYDRLLKSKNTSDEVAEFQKQCDALTYMSIIKGVHPTELQMYTRFRNETDELAKAMNTGTAAQGADWVPTDFSQRLYRQVELEAKVADLFEDVPMTSPTQKLPIDTAGLTMYAQNENTNDVGTKFEASTASVANLSLVAKKPALRAVLSNEVQEDSIIDIIDFINDRIARAIAAGHDNMILNGDTAGTHMDTDVTASNDIKKLFLGIRALAVDGSHGAAIAGAALAELDIRTARKAMGKYGVDPNKLAIVTGPTGYLQMIAAFDNFRTLDKYGALSTIFSGELGKFDGIPVIVSDQYKEDLNATGVYDGVTTTKTSVSLVYRPGIVLGTKRGISVKSKEDIETDQTILVASMRKAMIDLYDESTEPFIYHVYNVA